MNCVVIFNLCIVAAYCAMISREDGKKFPVLYLLDVSFHAMLAAISYELQKG